MITIRIPTPPSANAMWRSVGGRTLLSKQARAWKRVVGPAIRAQLPRGWVAHAGPVALTLAIQVPGLASDASNRIKLVEDAFTAAGVWADDRQVVRIVATKHIGVKGACDVVATVEACEAPEIAKRLATAEKAAMKRKTAPPAPTWRDLDDEQEAPEPYGRGVPTPNVRGVR